jgi:hypothetical protein
MHPSTLSNWIRKYIMESSAADDAIDESVGEVGFIQAVPPGVGSETIDAGRDFQAVNDDHVSWHLPADLGVVQGTSASLGSLLMGVLQGLRS